MPELDRYIPGVPCWIDTTQPDPDAAAEFYGGLFGWELEDTMPAGSPGKYFIGRLSGGDVAAISAPPEGAPAAAVWNTYIWVESADETAAKVREAGGQVLAEPFDIFDFGPDGGVRRSRGRRVRRLAAGPAPRRGGRQRAGQPQLQRPPHPRPGGREGVLRRGVRLGGCSRWACGRCPRYGDHLEALNPGTRARTAEIGGPARFEEVVAAVTVIPDDQPDTPAHWDVTFAVADADAIAERAAELGGTVLVPPFDAPWIRGTVIRDPQGATFNANKFVPENKDMAPQEADSAQGVMSARSAVSVSRSTTASSGRPRPV